jgi:tetratricopeptide (TPR) repeat protein
MPTTYNGIGTHYYGKRNVQARTATCRSCQRVATLTSYDTRLWFVVVFVPIIPLGRKRVIDQCSVCSRHMAMDLRRYETEREVQTSASVDQYRASPTVETALRSHGELMGFHDLERAAEVRSDALRRYPRDAGLREALADQLVPMGLIDEARGLRSEAEAIDPKAPAVLIRQAHQHMTDGDLDEARASLRFAEAAGVGASNLSALGALDRLGGAYQAAGRHDEALEIAGILLREAPQIGQSRDFRAFVTRSEKVVKPPFTLLPERDRSVREPVDPTRAWAARNNRRTAVIVGLGLVAVAAGLAGYNEWTRGHRQVHVVNGTGEALTVSIDSGEPVTIGPGVGEVPVAEGHHKATFGGEGGAAQTEPIEFDVDSTYWARFTGKPLWILNPGGEAVIQESRITYAEEPLPVENRLLTGNRFVAVEDVDYAFVEPPETIRLSRKGPKQVVKTAVQWVPLDDESTFDQLMGTDREAGLGYAERRLRKGPSNPALLESYIKSIRTQEEVPRVAAFLKTGRDRRPVDVAWLRADQSLDAAVGGDPAALRAWYDGAVAKEPNNGSLLYLRSRLETDPAAEREWIDRAIAADPKLGWPWRTIAGRALARGEWEECVRAVGEARSRGMTGDPDLDEMEHIARLGLGEASKLADAYHAALAANAHDHEKVPLLFDAMAALGQGDRIGDELTGWMSRLPMEAQTVLGDSGVLRALAAYQAGHADECLAVCEQKPMLKHTALHAEALAALGRASEVDSEAGFEGLRAGNYWAALSVALALGLEGQAEAAGRWREGARTAMTELHGDLERVAGWLAPGAGAPSLDDVAAVPIDPKERALLLATLAAIHPDREAEYLGAAKRFNLRRVAPYLVVERAIAAGEGKAATPAPMP